MQALVSASVLFKVQDNANTDSPLVLSDITEFTDVDAARVDVEVEGILYSLVEMQ